MTAGIKRQPGSTAVRWLLIGCLLAGGHIGICAAQSLGPITSEPSYPILAPLEGSALRVLFLGDYERTDFIRAEIADRLAMTSDALYTTSRDDLTRVRAEDGAPFPGSSSEEFVLHVASLLEKPWDTIWLDMAPEVLPASIRDILRRLNSAGTGVVLVGDTDGLRKLTGTGKEDKGFKETVSYPSCSEYRVFTGSKNRTAVAPISEKGVWRREAGDQSNAAAALVLAVSPRRTSNYITSLSLSRKPYEQESLSLMYFRIIVAGGGKPDSASVICRIRNDRGRIAAEERIDCLVTQNRDYVSLPFPSLPIGVYSVDVSLEGHSGIQAFCGGIFAVVSGDSIQEIRTNSYGVAPGDYLIGTVALTQPLKEGAALRCEVRTLEGVFLERIPLTTVIGRKSADFAVPARASYPRVVMVRVTYIKNNTPHHEVEIPLIVDRPYDPAEFNLVLRTRSYPGAVMEERLRQLSMQGVGIVSPRVNSLELSEIEHLKETIVGSGLAVLPDLTSIVGTNAKDRTDTIQSAITLMGNLVPLGFCSTDPPLADLLATKMNMIDRRGKETSVLSGLTDALAIRREDDPARLRQLPWRAFVGGDGAIWWDELPTGAGYALTPGWRLTSSFNRIAEESNCIANGIDTLLNGATKTKDERDDSQKIRTVEFNDGTARYITIFPDEGSGSRDISIETLTGTIPGAVYNMRDGVFLGVQSKIDWAADDSTVGLFSVLPYRVQTLVCILEKRMVESGEPITFEVEVVPIERTILTGRHVIQVSLTRSNGQPIPGTGGFLTTRAGKSSSTIVLPVLEKADTVTLNLKDTASGKEVSSKVIVKGAQ